MEHEFARSLSGHDQDQVYLIWKKEGRFAYLVNGTTHTIEHPKKKNVKHYQVIRKFPEDIWMQRKAKESWTDDTIRQAILAYERSINQ